MTGSWRLAALVALTIGCSVDTTEVGNVLTDCAAGSTCTCSAIGNCVYDCPGGGCTLVCSGMSNCVFDCAGGGCVIQCANTGNCLNTCTDGCAMTCTGTGNCSLSCDAQATSCTRTCPSQQGNCF